MAGSGTAEIVNVVSGSARPVRYSSVWKMMRWFSLQNHLSSITPAGSASTAQAAQAATMAARAPTAEPAEMPST